jgi:hypothetical protein
MKIDETIDKYLNENNDIENLIRNHLSGTNRKVTKESLFAVIKGSKKISKSQFEKVFKSLVDDDYLVKTKDGKYT